MLSLKISPSSSPYSSPRNVIKASESKEHWEPNDFSAEENAQIESKKIVLSSEEISICSLSNPMTIRICDSNITGMQDLMQKLRYDSEEFTTVFLNGEIELSFVREIPKNIWRVLFGSNVTPSVASALPPHIQIVKICVGVHPDVVAKLPNSVKTVIIEDGVCPETVNRLPIHIEVAGVENVGEATAENLLAENLGESAISNNERIKNIISAIPQHIAVELIGRTSVTLIRELSTSELPTFPTFTLPTVTFSTTFRTITLPTNFPTSSDLDLPSCPTSSICWDRHLEDAANLEYQYPEDALKSYRKLADEGCAEAHHRCAVMLLEGRGRGTERNSLLAACRTFPWI